jgi:predicted amidohydrolase YtcJ
VTSADLLLANGRVVPLERNHSSTVGDTLAVRDGRIMRIGRYADLRDLIGPDTQVLDAEGGLLAPAFHDAHVHLLTLARTHSRVNCSRSLSLSDISAAVSARAALTRPGGWIQAFGYDDGLLAERRHPIREDLDSAAPRHPVRLQHRSLHLDIVNTMGLQELGLMDLVSPSVERDVAGRPTGRLWHAGELLHGRTRAMSALATDVANTCEELLRRGVTTVHDASVTNDAETWALFHQLGDSGSLSMRLFVMTGARNLRELAAGRPATASVRRGPTKLVVDESTSDLSEMSHLMSFARQAGQSVAIHATSEAELILALDLLQRFPPVATDPTLDRIEHAAVVPDALLPDVRSIRATVVGQPALLYLRGDRYQIEFPPEQHGWLHRVGSFRDAGIAYVASSDAPVTPADPQLMLRATRLRRTVSGALMADGQREQLSFVDALATVTSAPARVAGVWPELGTLRAGAIADVVVLDPRLPAEAQPDPRQPAVRMTIKDGTLVWRR